MRPLSFILPGLAIATVAVLAISASHRSGESTSPKAPIAENLQPTAGNTLRLLTEAERSVYPNATRLDREIATRVRLLRVRPDHAETWVRLGDALLQRSRDTLDVTLYDTIKRAYSEAHRLDRGNPDALIGLAWATGAVHRFDESTTWARAALKIDASLPAAYGILGDAAVELGRYDEASQHYQKMLDLRPDMGSYSRAAHLLYLQGNAPRALALMRQAIRAGGSQPEHAAWCTSELVTMLCHEGASTAARQLADSELKRSPANALLLAAAGHARMSSGDDAGAIAAFERAIAIAPQHQALASLHDLYLAAGRTTDADAIARRIHDLHLLNKAHRVAGGEAQLARFLADRGENLPEAVRLAEIEYSHHRTAPAADTLAWALHRSGRHDEAAKTIREALTHRSPDPAILYHAGLIDEALGNAYDARRHLYAAVSREPRFNPVHAPLAYAALTRLGSVPPSSSVAHSAVQTPR